MNIIVNCPTGYQISLRDTNSGFPINSYLAWSDMPSKDAHYKLVIQTITLSHAEVIIQPLENTSL